MKLYLARHGQNEDNAAGILNGRRNLSLTERGRQQAREVAAQIKKHNLTFDAVLTSPLQRARETAKIISRDTDNPEPVIEDLLLERDFGVMTGQHHSRIEELCAPDIIQTDTITYFLSPEDAETFPELISRSKKLLTMIKHSYPSDATILLVGHGDMGKMIYSAYYGLPWKDVLTQFHFGNSDLLLLSKDSEPDEAHVFTVKQFNI